MTARKSPAANGAISKQDDTSTIPLIGATVEAQLQSVADRLMLGEIQLNECTPAIGAVWTYAFEAGRRVHGPDCQHKLDRLAWERDLWYFCANNPGKPPSDFYRAATAALWDEAVAS